MKTAEQDDKVIARKVLVVAADLGSFAAYVYDPQEMHSRPRLEQIDAFDTVEAHTKKANTLTVMERRRGHGTARDSVPQSVGTSSDGEQHNMELEKRRRLMTALREKLEGLLRRPAIQSAMVAAPAEILKEFLIGLTAPLKNKIERTIARDLTKVGKAGLIQHFGVSEMKNVPDRSAMAERAMARSPKTRKAMTKSGNTKKRRINKALDRRFTLRHQRPPLSQTDQGEQSLTDLADVPRQPRPRKGPRRVQLGITLRQGELAQADPAAAMPPEKQKKSPTKPQRPGA